MVSTWIKLLIFPFLSIIIIDCCMIIISTFFSFCFYPLVNFNRSVESDALLKRNAKLLIIGCRLSTELAIAVDQLVVISIWNVINIGIFDDILFCFHDESIHLDLSSFIHPHQWKCQANEEKTYYEFTDFFTTSFLTTPHWIVSTWAAALGQSSSFFCDQFFGLDQRFWGTCCLRIPTLDTTWTCRVSMACRASSECIKFISKLEGLYNKVFIEWCGHQQQW